MYSRPHGPTAQQADDVIFQDDCAVHESMKLESAKGSKVIVKNFFLKLYLFPFLIHTKQAKTLNEHIQPVYTAGWLVDEAPEFCYSLAA